MEYTKKYKAVPQLRISDIKWSIAQGFVAVNDCDLPPALSK